MALPRRCRVAAILAGLGLCACNETFEFDPPGPKVNTPPVGPVAPPPSDAAPLPEPDATPSPDAAADVAPPDVAVDTAPPPRDAAPPDLRPDVAADLRPDTAPGPILCGSPDPGCSCSGTQCSCGLMKSCAFTGMGCERPGGSCTLLCHNRNRCTGQCLHNCHLECYGGSNCDLTMGDNATVSVEGAGGVATVTVGPGSHIKCERNSTCSITCTGSCSLECEEGANCNLRCGAAASKPADSGGSCN
jgi:hypothetical protein